MRLVPFLEVLTVNLILAALFLWVTADDAYRLAYWSTEGFVPTFVRYPLFFVTSATKGSTTVGGLLTVDLQQVIILALVIIDGLYLWGVIRAKRNPNLQVT